MKHGHLQTPEWDALIERYFDALTSPEEEAALRRFLTSPEAAAPKYDEVRAVMGFLAVGRRVHAPAAAAAEPRHGKRRLALRLRVAAAAAAVAAIGLGVALTAPWTDGNDDACVAYVGGKRVTDTEAVMTQMRQSMADVARPDDEPTIEQQLGDMFDVMDL